MLDSEGWRFRVDFRVHAGGTQTLASKASDLDQSQTRGMWDIASVAGKPSCAPYRRGASYRASQRPSQNWKLLTTRQVHIRQVPLGDPRSLSTGYNIFLAPESDPSLLQRTEPNFWRTLLRFENYSLGHELFKKCRRHQLRTYSEGFELAFGLTSRSACWSLEGPVP